MGGPPDFYPEMWLISKSVEFPVRSQSVPELNLLRDPVVRRHEGVHDPESDVGEEQEGDELPPRLRVLLPARRAYPPPGFGHCGT